MAPPERPQVDRRARRTLGFGQGWACAAFFAPHHVPELVEVVRGGHALQALLHVVWQAPCSLTNGQRVVAAPVALVEAAGFRVSEPQDGGRCCGSAGVYNVLESAMADELGRRKAEALGVLAPEIVVSANIGCMTQLAGHMEQPVVHLVELLDWATGGPLPVALRARSFGL